MCQGERDPNGRREEVQQLSLSKSIQFHWLADSDDNFNTRTTPGRNLEKNMAEAIRAITRFIDDLL
jgi:predicted alpha/beta-hydrolase family hydrolase